ncbi:MOSC domain-containing protein [Rhizobium populisoli]|uniref:MOSC domain-containing protein n=1 Tax=Rhizobium populisoli TaxID=2859785 RepID=UPI001FE8672E|nr:MOSC domain-containing protein [Rhizobium populisoli]
MDFCREIILVPVGWVAEIWRYPVSSLGGERLASVDLIATGVPGDRAWAVVDAQTGKPAAPEKEPRWRSALFLSSRLRHDIPEIGFPDREWIPVDALDMDKRLSHHFGFDVSVRPYELSAWGTFVASAVAESRYALSPLHLVTSSSMEWLANLLGTDEIDCRRFRPNIVLNTSGMVGLPETAWLGCCLKMGSATMLATEETKRCGMTLIAQPGLSENPDILRSILRQNRRNFGIYGFVGTEGAISVGDAAILVRDQTKAMLG